jgi:hypothetical protein
MKIITLNDEVINTEGAILIGGDRDKDLLILQWPLTRYNIVEGKENLISFHAKLGTTTAEEFDKAYDQILTAIAYSQSVCILHLAPEKDFKFNPDKNITYVIREDSFCDKLLCFITDSASLIDKYILNKIKIPKIKTEGNNSA